MSISSNFLFMVTMVFYHPRYHADHLLLAV